MTHLQKSTPGWTESLKFGVKASPSGYKRKLYVKAFDAGLLVDAREKWGAYGHDQNDLYCSFRFEAINHYPDWGRDWTWDEAVDFCIVDFRRYIDGTWLDKYLHAVNAVETWNEHTDSDMCRNPTRLKNHLLFEQAAAHVWETVYRGKIVPAACQLIIVNSPVGNDIPRQFYKLAVDSDNKLGVHLYSRWWNLTREPGDFRYLSGRPFFNEAEYGIHPQYAITEAGPFGNVDAGWRHPQVLDSSIPLLVEAERVWIQDIKTTDAWARDDIIGPAMFTSGHVGWEYYQMEAPEMIECNKLFYDEWVGEKEDDYMGMDPARKSRIQASLNVIKVETAKIQVELDDEGIGSTALFMVKMNPGKSINIRDSPLISPDGIPLGKDIGDTILDAIYSVYIVSPTTGWYKISPDEAQWISGKPAYSTRLL